MVSRHSNHPASLEAHANTTSRQYLNSEGKCIIAVNKRNLAEAKCVPCEGNTRRLGERKAAELLEKLGDGWRITKNKGVPQLQKTFEFKNFAHAMAFVNITAQIAESQGHHPNIYIFGWNKVRIELYTHAIRGLHKNDFIMAAKINVI